MYINIDSNKYKDTGLALLHMGLLADRFKKRESIEDLTLEKIIECVGNNGQAFCRALLDGGTDEKNFVGQILLVLGFECPAAHYGRCQPQFIFGESTYPIVPYRH